MRHSKKRKPWATNSKVDVMRPNAPALNHFLRGNVQPLRIGVLLLLLTSLLVGCSQVPVNGPVTDEKITASAQSTSDAIMELEQRSKAEPDNAELLYELSLAYLAENEKHKNPLYRAQAEKHLRHILTLVPGNPATLKLLYNIYYENIVAGESNAHSKAHHIFTQMTPANRRQVNAPSLGVFLHAYLQQKQGGQQTQAAEKNKSAKQNSEQLYRALLAAINEQPEMDKAYIQLARMYREASYYPLALATLKLGEEQIKDSEDLYEAIAITYETGAEAEGCSYEKNHYLKSAIHYYQQAIPLAPESANIHYALARLFLDQNQYQLALHESGILIELEPTAENIAFHAQNYSMIGNHGKAYELLAQSMQKGLSNDDPAHHEIYMNAGDWPKAALSFTDYLQTQQNISVYDVAKADIIGQQADLDFSSLIKQKKLNFRSEWEGAVYAYWTGKMSLNQFGQNASNRCERTEYFFYSGYRDYRDGNISSARRQFSAALEQNTYRFIERPLAQHFLSSLDN